MIETRISDNRVAEVLKTCVTRAGVKLLSKLQAIDPKVTGINFEYGHYTDIQSRLQQYSMEHRNIYPLFCLFEDFKTERGVEGLDGVSKLTAILLWPSKSTYTREQREAISFVPVLYPCYKEILKQIKYCGQFNVYDESMIKHAQVNRPHWGDPVLFEVDGYLFGAALDGIELADLQLETYLQNC